MKCMKTIWTLPTAESLDLSRPTFCHWKAILPNPTVKVFASGDLDLIGDWSVAFPRSLGRFPLQGSGKRYVHGGISLQEVVVPVVKIHKARTDDTGQVEVEILRVPCQDHNGASCCLAVSEQASNRQDFATNAPRWPLLQGRKELSEIKTYTFDSKQTEARQREVSILLTLARTADAFNNQRCRSAA